LQNIGGIIGRKTQYLLDLSNTNFPQIGKIGNSDADTEADPIRTQFFLVSPSKKALLKFSLETIQKLAEIRVSSKYR